MAARFYIVQWCHRQKGWLDLPSLSSKKEKECEKWSLAFAQQHTVATRVVRKPHGWAPPIDVES